MKLHDLAVKYCSDKLYAHSYIDEFYEKEFANREPKSLLEIGLGYRELMEPFVPKFINHSSMKMWSDYFPKECRIVGIDINMKSLMDPTPAEYDVRYLTKYCDQGNPSELLNLIGEIGRQDIIIDDGSHQTEHQIISATTLLPYLRKGGIYVIEDVQEPKYILDNLNYFWNYHGYIYRFNKRPDDCLVVIRRD